MKGNIIFGLVVVLMSTGGLAQPFNVEMSFALGTPQGDFQKSLDREAYGADLAFTYRLGRHSPIHLGAGVLYQNYGWKERNSTFLPEIPEVAVNVRTTNNMITPHLILRVQPELGGFSPFVEGTWGFNYLFTESSIRDEWDDEEIASSVNYDYFTSNIGIGGGAKIRLWEGYDDEGDFVGVHLLVKSRYMLGGEAMYLKEGDLINNGNSLEYHVSRSRTDITTFNVGLVFSF